MTQIYRVMTAMVSRSFVKRIPTPYDLKVQQQGGRLVLTGRVRTGAERDLAGALAQQAASVPVDNAVEVGP